MERLVFVIGIDRYRYPDAPLFASVSTMSAYVRYFRSAYGGQVSEIVPLANEEATRERVLWEIQRRGNRVWTEVIFVFIGHGAREGIGLVRGMIRYRELADALCSVPAIHHLVILDTCHAGASFSAFGAVGDVGLPDVRERMFDLLVDEHPELRMLAAVPGHGTTWQVDGQSVFSAAVLDAAVEANPDLALGGVSVARVLAVASNSLVSRGYERPVSRGSLAGFPFGLSDARYTFGSVVVSDFRPFVARTNWRGKLEWDVDFAVLVRDRTLAPATAQQIVHDGFGTEYMRGPTQSLVPAGPQAEFRWTETLPSVLVPWTGAWSTVQVHDGHGRLLAQQDSWWHSGLRLLPVRRVYTLPAHPGW